MIQSLTFFPPKSLALIWFLALFNRASLDSSLKKKKKTCDVRKMQNLCFPWRRGTTHIRFYIFLMEEKPLCIGENGQKKEGRSPSLKTGFFRQVRELKIQRKNPGSAFGDRG
jgi:hypothetical protein